MLIDCHAIKQYIDLRTHPKISSYSINVFLYTTTIDHDGATGGREQSSQDRHGGGLASSIVPQQRRDLTLVYL